MESLSREAKKSIVKSELFLLKEGRYISSHTYQEVVKAHKKFYEHIEIREQWVRHDEDVKEPPLAAIVPEESIKPLKPKVIIPKKSIKTEEQIRERNITWLLNLGVILLLIGGLYVATSNWATMSNITKAGSIGLISILFYGIAFVSKKVLRIDKTAFAFLILGSLFLPIFLLSIGWFQLVGTYLSIFGDGRYLFGMLSSFLVLPVYVLLGRRLSSRLFVWFAYLAMLIGMGFLIASFRVEEDSFFLGMTLFQALLLLIYHRTKANENLKLFTREFVYFAQLNLILTTLLMLVLYHSNAYLGFNLILTAIIFLSMVYVTGKKEYHFVFSAMLVFGVYQFVQFSFLSELSTIIYAILGFVFLLVPRMLDDGYPWKRIFTFTSGVVSGLAFLFITFEAILIKWGTPSFTLLLSYVAIAGNFLYLSNTIKKWLFRYLTAVFMSIAFLEGLLLINEKVDLRPFVLFVFMIGFIMFTVFGVFAKVKYLDCVQQPARDIGWFYMGTALYAALVMYAWWELGVILLFISLCAFLSLKNENRTAFKPLAEWLVPIAVGLGVVAFGEEWRLVSEFYNQEWGVPTHFIISALVLLAIHIRIRNIKAFYVAHVFYTIAILLGLVLPINEDWVRPLIFIGGIGMYAMLYNVTKIRYFSYLVSLITLAAYFNVLYSIGEMGNLQFIVGAVLLFAITKFMKNKELYRAFAVVGHIYMPFAFIFTLFMYENEAIWSFLIGVVIYGISTLRVEQEWQRKLFLYSTFTSLFVVFATGIAFTEGMDGEFAYLFTSIVITGFWLFADTQYKKRIIYYLVPFSFLGILAFMVMYPFQMLPYVVSLLYSIGTLVVLHVAKWELLTAIPTLFIYGGTLLYLMFHPFGAMNEQLTLAVFGVVFLLAGKWFYEELFGKKTVDVYTMGAFLFFATMFVLEQPTPLIKILPGLLMAGALWLQRIRVPSSQTWLPTFIAGMVLLQPYYVLLGELNVHHLLEMEAIVLPFVVLGIYLRICLQGRYERMTNWLQWAILIFVSAVLVVDGLETSTVYDALIVGCLSLGSILAGVFWRIKSYFIVGSGVLLLNVFMQTRSYWGNLPWWAYLLIAGSILIGVASSNEWNKQKASRGERTILAALKNKVTEMWKQWK